MTGKSASAGTVVIVDEPHQARAGSHLLHSMGYEVLVAAAGEAAAARSAE